MHTTPSVSLTAPRRLVTAAALVLAAAVGAGPATAHTEISSSSPGRGKTAKTTIASVRITFSGSIRRGSVKVVGPGQTVVSVGAGGRDPRNTKRLLVGLKARLKAGQYKVSWRIIAGDGHFQAGTFTFKLVKP